MKRSFIRIFLIVLPVIFLVSGLTFKRAKYAGDPEYIYLMNALNLVQGKAVGHIDNPGTTVMEFGAIVLEVFHVFDFSNKNDLVTSVLQNPDRYVGLLQSAFVILNTLIFFLIGLLVFIKTRNIWYALLFQISPFFSVNVLEHAWTKVSPEPMLLFTTTLLALLIVLYYFSQNRRSYRYVLWFSLLAGFGLATKATFLPLLIIPILILPGMIRKLLYLPGFVASFVIFTSPAIPEYKNMFNWFYGLSTHTGVYGQGEKGFIDFAVYFDSLIAIFQNNPVFTAIFFLGCITLLILFVFPRLRKKGFRTLEFKILFALVLAIGGGILMVAKHYHSNHYLLPELSLSGLIIFMILYTLKMMFPGRITKNYSIILIVLASLVLLPFLQIPVLKQNSYYYELTNEEEDLVNQEILKTYPNYTQVYWTGSLNKPSALKFGNVYTKKKNTVVIREVYPEVFFFDNINQRFYNWETEIVLEDIIKKYGHRLLMVGGPRSDSKIQEMANAGFPLKTIHNGRTLALHEFDTTLMYYPDSLLNMKPLFVYKFDMETIDPENNQFIADNIYYGNGDSRSTEMARSGKHAVKLDKNRKFALELKLEKLKAGERYKISIWRFAEENNAHLVASAKNSDVLYKSTSDYTEKDEKGWKLMALYIDIPEIFEEETLTVYLWNPGKSSVYFDDLMVSRIW